MARITTDDLGNVRYSLCVLCDFAGIPPLQKRKGAIDDE
jgi:hypothetical protein